MLANCNSLHIMCDDDITGINVRSKKKMDVQLSIGSSKVEHADKSIRTSTNEFQI